ncbi:MAG TPA: hypothetical protein PLF15_02675 [bacterium]|nr:hypothetical protein [bacterium]
MKKFFALTIVLIAFVTVLFAGDVPTLKLENWTDLNGQHQVVARGKTVANADVTIYGRTNGGGQWSKIGVGKSDANGKYGIVIDGGNLENGYNVLKAVEGTVESAISRKVWVSEEKIYLSKPVDPRDKKIAELEKALAAAKASQPAATEINVAPALAKKAAAGTPTSNLVGAAPAKKIEPAAPTAAAKTFPVKVESDQAFDKFGLTVNSWSEWENGETVYLSPGDYGVNAAAGKLWAYDQASIATGKPNFTLSVNGVALTTSGTDNTVGGANAWFRVNPDGSITPMQ